MLTYAKRLGVLALIIGNLYLYYLYHKVNPQIDLLQAQYKELKDRQFEWNRVHAGRMDAFFRELIDLYEAKVESNTEDTLVLPSPQTYYGHGWFQFVDPDPDSGF